MENKENEVEHLFWELKKYLLIKNNFVLFQ